MYVFLLLLGAVTTAAGLALVASGGVSDTEVLTPGTIAAVGGLLLIGMALAIHELQRIERALAVRPMPRPSRPGEVPAAAEQANGPARIPFPPKPKAESRSQTVSPATNAGSAPGDDAAFERLREKFPALVRLENAPIVEETDVSLLPPTPARAEEEIGEGTNGRVGGRSNGATARAVPRLEVNARASGPRERLKGSVFDAFWPKGQRLGRGAQTAPAQVADSQPTPSVELAPVGEAVPDTQSAAGEPVAAEPAAATPSPVSILKSGVVEGMAYTLYSDGSIEAQLPQGTLRFGSITDLRNHIENES
jgi:hypothetical protein